MRSAYRLMLVLVSGISMVASAIGEPRFTYSLGAEKKLCQAQFKMLIQRPSTEALPVCDIGINLPPGAVTVPSKKLDIASHEILLHLIELRLKHQFKVPPSNDFNVWHADLQQCLKTPSRRPHLLELNASTKTGGSPSTILAYHTGNKPCNINEFATWSNHTGMQLFVYDQGSNTLQLIGTGYLVNFEGQLFLFSSYLSEYRVWIWKASILQIRHIPQLRMRGTNNFIDFDGEMQFDYPEACVIDAEDHFSARPPMQFRW